MLSWIKQANFLNNLPYQPSGACSDYPKITIPKLFRLFCWLLKKVGRNYCITVVVIKLIIWLKVIMINFKRKIDVIDEDVEKKLRLLINHKFDCSCRWSKVRNPTCEFLLLIPIWTKLYFFFILSSNFSSNMPTYKCNK